MHTVHEVRISGRYLRVIDTGYRASGENAHRFEATIHKVLTPEVFRLYVEDNDSTGLLSRFAVGTDCLYEREAESRQGYFLGKEAALLTGRKVCERHPYEAHVSTATVRKFVGDARFEAERPQTGPRTAKQQVF